MKYLLSNILFIFLSVQVNLVFAIHPGSKQELYPFDSTEQRQLFDKITSESRCLVCQNETLADSTSGLANDLRREIYQQVKSGSDQKSIEQYLVERYGQFILFKPKWNALNAILWVTPFAFILIIIIAAFYWISGYQKKKITRLASDVIKKDPSTASQNLPVWSVKTLGNSTPVQMRFWSKFLLFLCAVMMATGLYWFLGSGQAWLSYQQVQKKQDHLLAEIKKLGGMEQMILRLRQQLQQKPEGYGFYLLGRLLLGQGEYSDAMIALQKATQFQNLSPEQMQQTQQMMAFLQAQLKEGTAVSIQLPVKVSLGVEYKKQVKDNDVLFVFAQLADQGERTPPVAVVRRLVKDLPLTVTLDETMAMLPDHSLAQAKQVRIVARISKTGQPQSTPGDLWGQSQVIDVKSPPRSIDVVIDRSVECAL